MPDLYLEGSVGAAFWPDEAHFTPATVRAALTAAGQEDVTVYLNSGGGVATDGLAIYHALRGHPGRVDVVITGIAASAASLIAMAGESITMREGAMMMIHDAAMAWIDGRGTEQDHRAIADALGKMSDGYAAIYARRAGITPEAAREIMRAETWFTPDEAVAACFATATETTESAPVAAFAYGAYRNTPRHLLGGARANGPGRQAVLAMIGGGVPASNPKGSQMTPEEEEAARLAAEGEDTTPSAEDMPPEDLEDGDYVPDGGEPPAGEDDDEETPADAKTATAIIDLVAMHNGTLDQAREFIAAKMTLTDVIAHYRQKGNTVPKPTAAGPTTRILRDERETRRAGMTEALVATMTNAREVNGPGRAFMGPRTISAMASAYMGRRNRYESPSRVVEMAFGSHSTSDFPAVFENALHKRLMNSYQTAQPVYRALAERLDFMDFRPHPISAIGDWPSLLPVGEGGEIKSGTVSDKKESVSLASFARSFHLTRQAMINDDLGAVDRMLSTRGRAIAAFEDQLFFAMALSGANADGPTLLETSRQMFNTTDGTKASTNAAITPASIALAFAAMRNRKGVGPDGTFLQITPSILLVGPAKEFEALQLIAPIQSAQASNVNPYVGKLQVVVSPYITGNAWYLLADPGEAPIWMYGYLQGDAAPRLRVEEPFGRQGISYSVELDMGVGATDFRGGYKNAGA